MLVVEQELRERPRELGLADPGRAKEDKAPERTVGILKSRPGAADRVGDRPDRLVLTDDAVVVLVIGDVETDRGRSIRSGIGLAERVWESAAAPEGYTLAGVALDDVAAGRKMTKLWGVEAGRATKMDRILVLGASEAGRRRALAGAGLDIDWSWPPRALRAI